MRQYRNFIFTGCILYLITIFPATRPADIRCEQDATGYYVCTNATVPVNTRDCCYNYELHYYYCCPLFEYRSESYTNRFIGLIVASVIIIILICLLCIFFERCPGRWYLKKCLRRERDQNT